MKYPTLIQVASPTLQKVVKGTAERVSLRTDCIVQS